MAALVAMAWPLSSATAQEDGDEASAPEIGQAEKPEKKEAASEEPKEEAQEADPGDVPPTLEIKVPELGFREAFRMDRRVFDTTGRVPDESLERIQLICADFQEQTEYAVGVVILNRMAETGLKETNARDVARRLLDQWKTMLRNPEKSVLVFLAMQDGKVVIWIGRGWGGRYDPLIDEIIKMDMVPELSPRGKNGEKKESNVAGAVLAALRKLLPAMYKASDVGKQPVGNSFVSFLGRSWLWLLMALHGLGMVYVLSTKESFTWYLAGLFLGLPIFLGMVFLVLQGGDDERPGAGTSGVRLMGGGDGKTAEKPGVCSLGNW